MLFNELLHTFISLILPRKIAFIHCLQRTYRIEALKFQKVIIETEDKWSCKCSPDILALCNFAKFDIVLKWVMVNSGS